MQSTSRSRRRFLKRLLAFTVGAVVAPTVQGKAQKERTSMLVVRISRGSFPPEKYEKVKSRLDASQESLIPAIRKLNGLLHYYVGIDHVSNTMVNVSVWKSLADAKQMDTLAPMLALASEFPQLGVSFERPIINYDTLWGM